MEAMQRIAKTLAWLALLLVPGMASATTTPIGENSPLAFSSRDAWQPPRAANANAETLLASSQAWRATMAECLVAPTTSSGAKPDWLRRIDEGNAFNKAQSPRYPHNEVYIEKPGGGYYRLDSYNDALGEIVSRKFTQLGEVQEATAINYIKELAAKYPAGSRIASVPSSGGLAGSTLRGQMILEVPVQVKPIPQAVLDAANKANILIRDVTGRIY
jgi:hypothetical protein